MNNDLLFDGKTYISVGRASKKLGYTADYIGQLCRAGKIDAKMIGRTWYVEWESVKNHKKSKKHRIRRTAEEIRKAREMETLQNLSVTKSAVLESEKDKDCPPEEYLAQIDEKNESKEALPVLSQKEFLPEPLKQEIVVEKKEEDCPPEEYLKKIDEALPITYASSEKYLVTEDLLPKLSKVQFNRNKKEHVQSVVSTYHPNHTLVGALAVFIFINVLFVGANIVSPEKTSRILSSISNIDLQFKSPNEFAIQNPTQNQNFQNTSSIYSGIKDVVGYLFGGIREKINHYAISYMKSLGFAPKEASNNPAQSAGGPVRNGMVVVPDDKDHNKTVASIKNTFSDDVSVVPDADEQSGIIVPHFKEVDGDTYTYVLIPVNSP